MIKIEVFPSYHLIMEDDYTYDRSITGRATATMLEVPVAKQFLSLDASSRSQETARVFFRGDIDEFPIHTHMI